MEREYRIQAPDGTTLRIVGPADATPDQLRAAAERAFASRQQVPQPAQPSETRVAPEVQAARDADRATILQQELAVRQQAAQTGDARAVADVAAIQRELARIPGALQQPPVVAPAVPQQAAVPVQTPVAVAPEQPALPVETQGQIPGAGAYVAPQATEPAAPGIGAQVARQLGLTARAGAEGAASFTGVFTDPIAAVINQFVPPERRLSTLRSVVSTLLTQAGVPEPETATERVVQEAATAVAAGGRQLSAARELASAAAPTTRAVGQQLAVAPTAQLTGAAGAGGAAQTAAEAGAGPGAQLAAGLAGGVVGGVAPMLQRQPGQTAQDIEAARQAGVRLMTSDVRPPTTTVGRVAERVGEAIPLTGTTRVRTAQQQERVNAVNKLLSDYGFPTFTDDLSEQLTRDVITKRSADLKRLTTARDDVLTRNTNQGAVPLSKTAQTIQDEIAKLRPGAGTPEVDRVISDLQGFFTTVQGKDLQGLEITRRVLRDKYADPSLANIKTIGQPSLNRLYSAVVSDMGDFIKTVGQPNDYNKWRSSSAELGDLASELNSTALKAVLRRGELTPELVDRALFNNKPSEVRLIYSNLSPQGKEVAKVAVLHRAASQATKLDERGAAQIIDPTQFATEVDKLGKTIGIVFNPTEVKRIEALTRVLNLTRRAQEVGAPVRVFGQQVPVSVPQVIGVGAVGNTAMNYLSGILGPYLGSAATVGTGLGVGALARVYESAPVRNLLDRIATTKPGSPAEARLVATLSALRVPAPKESPQE